MRLSKKEKEKLALQMQKPIEDRRLWTVRPTVFKSKKHDIKSIRREGKELCKTES